MKDIGDDRGTEISEEEQQWEPEITKCGDNERREETITVKKGGRRKAGQRRKS